MLRPQTVANIRISDTEIGVFLNEFLVRFASLNDVVRNVIQDHHVRLRRGHHWNVRQIEAAMLECRQYSHFDMGCTEAATREPCPKDGMHLAHVRAPENERIGVLEIIVTPHRLIDAEGSHETANRRRHAVTGVGINIVGAEAGLIEFGGRIAFPGLSTARNQTYQPQTDLLPSMPP